VGQTCSLGWIDRRRCLGHVGGQRVGHYSSPHAQSLAQELVDAQVARKGRWPEVSRVKEESSGYGKYYEHERELTVWVSVALLV
jgi:hypothetical protein